MEGDGLRAEGKTMDGREQTPSGMGSGVGLELYVDSDFASRDTNRQFVSGGVVMCAGACVSFFFLGRRKVSPFLLLRQSMLRWPRGSRRRLFLRYIWSFIFPDRDVGCTLNSMFARLGTGYEIRNEWFFATLKAMTAD